MGNIQTEDPLTTGQETIQRNIQTQATQEIKTEEHVKAGPH